MRATESRVCPGLIRVVKARGPGRSSGIRGAPAAATDHDFRISALLFGYCDEFIHSYSWSNR